MDTTHDEVSAMCQQVVEAVQAVRRFIELDRLLVSRATMRDLDGIEQCALARMGHNRELMIALDAMETDLFGTIGE